MRKPTRGKTFSKSATMPTDHQTPPESEMDDNESTMANPGPLPIPSQIYQLATVLHNILNSDREANAAILEKLENPQDDLNTSAVHVFTASDLAHLASHLATTSQTLAQHALNPRDGRVVRDRRLALACDARLDTTPAVASP